MIIKDYGLLRKRIASITDETSLEIDLQNFALGDIHVALYILSSFGKTGKNKPKITNIPEAMFDELSDEELIKIFKSFETMGYDLKELQSSDNTDMYACAANADRKQVMAYLEKKGMGSKPSASFISASVPTSLATESKRQETEHEKTGIRELAPLFWQVDADDNNNIVDLWKNNVSRAQKALETFRKRGSERVENLTEKQLSNNLDYLEKSLDNWHKSLYKCHKAFFSLKGEQREEVRQSFKGFNKTVDDITHDLVEEKEKHHVVVREISIRKLHQGI